MKVVDFFSGAGGWTEGFRQAGFKVVFSLDNWKPAQLTHKFNHPNCPQAGIDCLEETGGDILQLDEEWILNEMPNSEVIVGSPPCVAFSHSNKAGKADKSLGLKLIEKYLQIVAIKKHMPGSVLRYWAMENVPNSEKYVPEQFTFAEIGLDARKLKKLGIKKKPKDIALRTPTRKILNAANYGTPQTRRRFVCGDFPLPKETHSQEEWITMREVMRNLGNPLGKKKRVVDTISGSTVPVSKVTDHFYDTRVEEFEWSQARRLKEDHGFMGVMSFPEKLDRPSRTVMATHSSCTRESIIFDAGKGNYRTPTIREISSFMGFPVTYQFIGNNDSTKYKLIGNAVCVPMIKAIACAMKQDAGWKLRVGSPLPFRKPPVDLTGMKRKRKSPSVRRIQSKFHQHVPYLKVKGFRVELDNIDSDFDKKRFVWNVRLHHGSGKNMKHVVPAREEVEKLLAEVSGISQFKADVKKLKKPTALQLQKYWCRMEEGEGPVELLQKVRALVDKHFPEDKYGDAVVDNSQRAVNLEKDEIPLRIALSSLAVLS